jgi:acyl-CoA synthetase (AMP-forming)/AMP-acid ligase II
VTPFLTVFPMFGRVGYAWVAAGLYFGVRNVLAKFDPARVLQLIAQERVALTNLVATMGAMLLAHPDLPDRDLSSLRGAVFAGRLDAARADPPRRSRAHLPAPLRVLQGCQETGALVLGAPEDRQLRPDSVGVIPHAEVRIVDDAGRRLGPDEIGESTWASAGRNHRVLPERPGKTAETFPQRLGMPLPATSAAFDAQGYLFVRGRRRTWWRSPAGQNVFAAEVEEALLAHPGVADPRGHRPARSAVGRAGERSGGGGARRDGGCR